jgi:hypothetical protein
MKRQQKQREPDPILDHESIQKLIHIQEGVKVAKTKINMLAFLVRAQAQMLKVPVPKDVPHVEMGDLPGGMITYINGLLGGPANDLLRARIEQLEELCARKDATIEHFKGRVRRYEELRQSRWPK